MAATIKFIILGGYTFLKMEADISDFLELYVWRFFFGELWQYRILQEWFPWVLERISNFGILWAMNLWIQWAYFYVDDKVPKHLVVDYVPEFTPPNVVVSVGRHLWYSNPIYFMVRQVKRVFLWLKIWYHCHNMAFVSQEINNACTRIPDMRKQFLKFGAKIPIYSNSPDHTHPLSASYRTAVNEYMKDVVINAGFTPYSVSKSASDQIGNRFYYGIKDLGMVTRNDPVPENAALIFTDVDYYADMRHWLLLNKPIMMYTFAPSTLAGTTDEYSFRTVGDYVEYRVSGGAIYQHKIWDYKGDCMTVEDPSTNEVLTFNVEQRVIEGDSDHRIVLLTPMARVPYPHCLYLTGHCPLVRKTYGDGEYRHMFDPLTKILSLATDGAYTSIEISMDVYNAIRERIKAKCGMPLVSDIEKYLSQQRDIDAVLKAPLLFSLMDVEFRPNVVSTGKVQVSYQPFTPGNKQQLISEDGKPKGRAISNPILSQPALMPVKSVASDISSIEGRVVKPRNNRDPPIYLKHLKGEFVRNVIGTLAGTGSSLSTEEVQSKQDKPAQKARFENSKHYFSENVIGCLRTFIKAEGYSSPNDPRTITQVPQEVTTLLSEYTYAFKEAVLKKQAWYGPGKTPMETIDRLALLTTTDGVITTDFSRFDGSISEFLQSVAKACYMSYLTTADRARFGNLYKAIFVKTAYSECGVKYDAGDGTRSGSPITTDANTIINAYVMYCALRRLKMTEVDAMAAIGLACGDDGYLRNRKGLTEALVSVCTDLGLTLKPELHDEGPYPYLGRYFCDPATTETSFQDPMRTFAKIHISANSNVSNSQARVNKCLGYLTTDRLTPILAEYCKLALKPTDGDDPKTDYAGRDFSKEEQYRQTLAWPQHDADKDLIDQQVGKLCRLEALELERMVNLLKACSTYEDVPVLFDNDRPTKIVAEVHGLLEYPEGDHSIIVDKETSNESKSSRPTASNEQAPPKSRKRTMEVDRRPGKEIRESKPFKKNGRSPGNRNRQGNYQHESARANPGSQGGDKPTSTPARVVCGPSSNAQATTGGTGGTAGGSSEATDKVVARPKVKTVQRHGLGSGRARD